MTTRRFRFNPEKSVALPPPTEPEKGKLFLGRDDGGPFHVTELDDYMRGIEGYAGSHWNWELSKFEIPDRKLWGIVILLQGPQPSGRDVGHFVALVVDMEDYHEIDFFDPMGRSPTDYPDTGPDVIAFIARIIRERSPTMLLKVKVNKLKKMKCGEATCGIHVVQFLLDRLHNKKPFSTATGYDKRAFTQRKDDMNSFLEV